MACLVCGNQKISHLYDGILCCPSCRFAWADIELSDEELKRIYDRNYFFGEEYVDYLKEEQPLRRNFQRSLKWMTARQPKGSLFEVGCAYGLFMDEAQKYYDVQGVDIHKEGCEHAQQKYNIDARAGNFLEMDLPQESFDVIAMWDMLEHLSRPDLFIQKAHTLLKPNGYLFFSTLDITSLLASVRGKHWRQIHPPTHLSYFSWRSLALLLEKAGFRVVDRKYWGNYRSWDNTFYNLLVLRSNRQPLYEGLKRRRWLQGMYYLNTFDTVFCAATRN